MRKTPLKRGTSQLKRTPLKKSGTTKAKKVIRQKAFYSSAAWKRLRKEALERAGNRCEYILEFRAPHTVTGVTYPGTIFAHWTPDPILVQARCTETEGLHIHHTGSHFGGDERPEHLRCLCRYHHAIVEARDFPHRQRSR